MRGNGSHLVPPPGPGNNFPVLSLSWLHSPHIPHTHKAHTTHTHTHTCIHASHIHTHAQTSSSPPVLIIFTLPLLFSSLVAPPVSPPKWASSLRATLTGTMTSGPAKVTQVCGWVESCPQYKHVSLEGAVWCLSLGASWAHAPPDTPSPSPVTSGNPGCSALSPREMKPSRLRLATIIR